MTWLPLTSSKANLYLRTFISSNLCRPKSNPRATINCQCYNNPPTLFGYAKKILLFRSWDGSTPSNGEWGHVLGPVCKVTVAKYNNLQIAHLCFNHRACRVQPFLMLSLILPEMSLSRKSSFFSTNKCNVIFNHWEILILKTWTWRLPSFPKLPPWTLTTAALHAAVNVSSDLLLVPCIAQLFLPVRNRSSFAVKNHGKTSYST